LEYVNSRNIAQLLPRID